MANFEEFIKKTAETAETVAAKSMSFARVTGEKAKIVGKIVKLTTDINGEREKVKKTYRNLGRMYYEKHRESPEPEFEQCCTEVAVAHEAIRIKTEQLAALKTLIKEDTQRAKERAVETAVVVKVKTAEAASVVKEKAVEAAEKAKEAAENLKEKLWDTESEHFAPSTEETEPENPTNPTEATDSTDAES